MKNARAAITATVMTLTLAACGMQSEPEPAAPSSADQSTTASVEPTPIPEPTGASVSQWAAKIAPLKASWQDQQSSWEDAICSSIAAADADATDCQAFLVAMGFTAETISITVEGMTTPGGPTSLGEPPTEIANLHTDMTAAAEAAAEASKVVECPGDDCISTAFEFTRAWSALGAQLQSWEPYL